MMGMGAWRRRATSMTISSTIRRELPEHLGIRLLNERLNNPNIQDFGSIFQRTIQRTQGSLNFFTSIGLGGITDTLREYMKNMPELIMQQQKSASSESESCDSRSGASCSPESESSFDESDSKQSKRRKK
ncbi:hypothetical protein E2562_026104 [Oryza meyeriana var. granulata]|uniref:Uncharacterized protein n=1 Tax=Oryza meyeriana var. granulata TaxID=110450 RepID=A0A6G1C0M9_9ORYZ|nr:hypothetical protein E2562_026104 [Oryza meyeriana var. granulata]KAF0893507.1 hypothetical protein E2562_026104 [Oryza meyeriana var. granulata]KAF0893508.1 hypothetical protein E2562_026104 [Oryza meyeriana var. granulata]KAF0893509.1 hypothetical protein E2562_026104 [Oryza meyeriana var. granulata]